MKAIQVLIKDNQTRVPLYDYRLPSPMLNLVWYCVYDKGNFYLNPESFIDFINAFRDQIVTHYPDAGKFLSFEETDIDNPDLVAKIKAGRFSYNKQTGITGVYRSYFENHQIAFETNYTNGQRNGTQKKWFRNGHIESTMEFRFDRPNGLYKSWNENGQLKSQIEYTDGQMHGNYSIYKNNKEIQRFLYEQGIRKKVC